MFTRKKKALIVAIYIIAFSLLISIWGDNGMLANKMLRAEHADLLEKEDIKRADIAMLRDEASKTVRNASEGELIYSFSSNTEDSASEKQNDTQHKIFVPLSFTAVFFLSFIPAIAAILIIVAAGILKERHKNEGSNTRL